MKSMSGLALVVAAVLTSPALASAAAGEMAVDVALTRYLFAVGVSWVLLTVGAEWFWSEPAAEVAAGHDQADTSDSRDTATGAEPEPG